MGRRGEESRREETKMNNLSSGVWIAMAAILVQAPRLVLAVLAADRQVIAQGAERELLVLAGLGTAMVLTGGNLYLAHAIARVRRWRGGLVAVWLVVLASTGGLVVPMIAGGISGRSLPEILSSHSLAWAWSLLAALAHEVTAAGCMLSAAALARDAAAVAREERESAEIAEMLLQRDAAGDELATLLARQSQGEQEADSTEGAGARRMGFAGEAAAGAGSQALPAAVLTPCREGCGRAFRSALAEMGHLRHCPVRLERLRRRAAADAGGEGAREPAGEAVQARTVR
jgi:MFS family permease